MPITGPTTAVEGTTGLIITGSALDLVAPVELVASNGVDEFAIAQVVSGPRDATSITIDLDAGLTSVIGDGSQAWEGVPLTDSEWTLKWRVALDELTVKVIPPANLQLREIANSEKFGGWLNVAVFGEQDQIIGDIVTATNTVKHTNTNQKAAGYLSGIARTMTETITHRVWTAEDNSWRDLPVAITPFSVGGEFTEEFTPEFT